MLFAFLDIQDIFCCIQDTYNKRKENISTFRKKTILDKIKQSDQMSVPELQFF